jgi:alkylhydroperoxidase family enzyme
MPVIPYLPQDIQEPRELVAAIRARRSGQPLNLDRMLLHSPAFAAGWNSLLGAVRHSLTVPDRLRELAICTVAVINQAEYEFFQHAPEFIQAGGRDAQLQALQQIATADLQAEEFSPQERAVIDLSVAMTRDIQVEPEIMSTAKAALANDQQLLELIGIIAAYNMVSRFLVALGIEPE